MLLIIGAIRGWGGKAGNAAKGALGRVQRRSVQTWHSRRRGQMEFGAGQANLHDRCGNMGSAAWIEAMKGIVVHR